MTSKKTVMIIEDDYLTMKLLNDILEVYGYKTIQKRTGRGALEMALEHKPVLIFMDVMLPERSGLDVAQNLKTHTALKHIPIIAVTAFTDENSKTVCLDYGCDDYMVKPISISGINALVAKFIESEFPHHVIH